MELYTQAVDVAKFSFWIKKLIQAELLTNANFLFVPNSIDSVLPRCKDNLLSINQFWQLFNSFDFIFEILLGFANGTVICIQ